MAVDYEKMIRGHLLIEGYELEDIAKIRGCTVRTLQSKLKEPDKMDRLTLRILHKYGKIPKEELI